MVDQGHDFSQGRDLNQTNVKKDTPHDHIHNIH